MAAVLLRWKCGQYLKDIGFKKVVHSQEDFFKRVNDANFMQSVDLIWDNPPYTDEAIKTKVLEALVDSGKPFIMLLPITTLHVKFVRDLLDMTKVQVLLPFFVPKNGYSTSYCVCSL